MPCLGQVECARLRVVIACDYFLLKGYPSAEFALARRTRNSITVTSTAMC